MGYYMHMSGANFLVEEKNLPDMLDAIKSLKAGAWVDESEVRDASNVLEAMRAWFWEVVLEDGYLTGLVFNGEKYGDDDRLMQAIAPFVVHGPYIEMRGEDDDLWRWVFLNGKLHETRPTVVWPDLNEILGENNT